MEAAINLVNYLFNSQDLYIQYTRSVQGNDPQVFEKDWSQRKSIEERLQAGKPAGAPHSPNFLIGG